MFCISRLYSMAFTDPTVNTTSKTKHSVYLRVLFPDSCATNIEDLPCSLLRDFINLTPEGSLWDVVDMKASVFCPTFRKFKLAFIKIFF